MIDPEWLDLILMACVGVQGGIAWHLDRTLARQIKYTALWRERSVHWRMEYLDLLADRADRQEPGA